MTSADLIRNARRRAGLTQEQLARRSGHTRPSIARWEAGNREPTLATVQVLVEACDLALDLSLMKADSSLREQAREQLSLAPHDRLAELLGRSEARAAWQALLTVADLTAPLVLVGPVASVLRGTPQRPATSDVELVPADLTALARELQDHRFAPTDDARRFRDSDRRWAWQRGTATRVVIATGLPGGGDFGVLRRDATRLPLTPDRQLLVAHARDLLRLSEASADPAVRARMPGLRALLD